MILGSKHRPLHYASPKFEEARKWRTHCNIGRNPLVASKSRKERKNIERGEMGR
jgi:hypothetical protein